MNNKIIDGKNLSKIIKENLKELISKYDTKPCLAVIKVGNDPASEIYVKNKTKVCENLGIISKQYELNDNVKEEELINLIQKLNFDKKINGILVQLPLPKHINEKSIINIINPEKDVDCFSPYNLGKLFNGDFDFNNSILPCTPKGCIKLIKSVETDLTGKKVCIIGRSNIVGKPLAQLLLKENSTIKIVHSQTKNIKEETLWADIIIIAIGKKKFLKADMIKKNSIVIDVGINREGNKIYGDVDFDNIIDRVSYITPVPGGVGPMTIACLMENVFNVFLKQNNF